MYAWNRGIRHVAVGGGEEARIPDSGELPIIFPSCLIF